MQHRCRNQAHIALFILFLLFTGLMVALSGCGSNEPQSPLAPMRENPEGSAFSTLGGRGVLVATGLTQARPNQGRNQSG